MVGYLAHESNELTGGLFDASGGEVVARLFGTTPGYRNAKLSIEDIRDNLDSILDAEHLSIATDPRDAAAIGTNEMAHIFEPKPYQPI